MSVLKTMPTKPGAYMSSKDRGIWLLEAKSDGGLYWRMPGGFLMIDSAARSGPMSKVVAEHLPFRQMLPVRRR